MTVTLRAYEPTDLDRCMEIWWAASRHAHAFLEETELASDAELVRTLYMPGAEITVAESGGRIVAFIALIDSLVGGLFVDPEARRQGIGRLLMRHASKSKGVLTLEVYVANDGARAFYRALGYREILCHLTDDQGRPHPLIRMTDEAEMDRALAASPAATIEPPHLFAA